jgi:hypothetical protein
MILIISNGPKIEEKEIIMFKLSKYNLVLMFLTIYLSKNHSTTNVISDRFKPAFILYLVVLLQKHCLQFNQTKICVND